MDISPSTQLKARIMRRVYAIWLLRRLPWVAGEIAIVSLIASEVAAQVFVNHVLHNAIEHSFSRSPAALFSYFFNAFFHTQFVVQALLVSLFLLAFFVIRDIRRTTQPLVRKSLLQHTPGIA